MRVTTSLFVCCLGLVLGCRHARYVEGHGDAGQFMLLYSGLLLTALVLWLPMACQCSAVNGDTSRMSTGLDFCFRGRATPRFRHFSHRYLVRSQIPLVGASGKLEQRFTCKLTAQVP